MRQPTPPNHNGTTAQMEPSFGPRRHLLTRKSLFWRSSIIPEEPSIIQNRSSSTSTTSTASTAQFSMTFFLKRPLGSSTRTRLVSWNGKERVDLCMYASRRSAGPRMDIINNYESKHPKTSLVKEVLGTAFSPVYSTTTTMAMLPKLSELSPMGNRSVQHMV